MKDVLDPEPIEGEPAFEIARPWSGDSTVGFSIEGSLIDKDVSTAAQRNVSKESCKEPVRHTPALVIPPFSPQEVRSIVAAAPS